MEFVQIVNVQATNDVEIGRKVRAIKRIAVEPIEGDGQPEPDKPAEPLPPSFPPAPIPYFDIGEATGNPGETVEIVVEAGCLHPMTGFHIGGGVGLVPEVKRSGYGMFRAIGAKLGPYLFRYLEAEDRKLHTDPDEVGDHYFSTFRFMDWESSKSLPEEWWEFSVGLFSLSHEKMLLPVPIPVGTHLFTVEIEILPDIQPGVYELTCKDKWYYTHSRQRRRDFSYTYSPQGFTKIETFPGKITVR